MHGISWIARALERLLPLPEVQLRAGVAAVARQIRTELGPPPIVVRRAKEAEIDRRCARPRR